MRREVVHTVMRYAAIGSAALCVAVAGSGALPVTANAQVRPEQAEGPATDPIRCWWQSGKSAVYVGERFLLTLTCSVVDTPALRVLADQSRLDPAAVQLAPFDVVDGVRHPDIQAGARRFFQYAYSLRIIADGLFGRAVSIPAFDIHYRVQSTEGQAATVESMERTYRLPALPVRITALVPPQADDIRDGTPLAFDAVQRGRFRGNLALATAALLFSAALGCTAAAGGRVFRRRRTPRAAKLLPESGILHSAIRELQRVQREVERNGWTRDLASRALAAVRIGGAIALGQRLPQVPMDEEAAEREGALILSHGLIRPARLMVSASVTAEAVGLDDGFQSALTAFTAARYARRDHISGENLDRALSDALAVLRRLRAEQSWRVRTADRVARTLARRRE